MKLNYGQILRVVDFEIYLLYGWLAGWLMSYVNLDTMRLNSLVWKFDLKKSNSHKMKSVYVCRK